MTPEGCGLDLSVLAESPVWDWRRQLLLYLDFRDPHIIEFDPTKRRLKRTALFLRAPLGGVCLRESGGYLVVDRNGLHSLSEEYEVAELIHPPHPSFAQAPPNDLCVTPQGDLLIATADIRQADPVAGLYLLSPSLGWQCLVSGLTVGNGPQFSTDGSTLYLTDSPQGTISAFDWKAQASALGGRRLFAQVSAAEGLPDGLAVAADDTAWSARWGGAALRQYGSDGTARAKLTLPTSYVTSCAFGGQQLSTLYITTAHAAAADPSLRVTAEHRLFEVQLKEPGLPSVPCRF